MQYQDSTSFRYDFSSFQQLIRFVRNTSEHYAEINLQHPYTKDVLGNSQKTVMQYFTRTFPWLMVVTDLLVQEFKKDFTE